MVAAVRPLFGTDGVRGKANEDLTPELALALGRAAAESLVPCGGRVIVGRDTRVSGPMLEGALSAGLAASGADVCLAGIIPTPAISFLIKDEHADLGAVISASHNPPQDNGIKFFDRRGMKLSVKQEEAIEQTLGRLVRSSKKVGSVGILDAAASRYAAFLAGTIESDEVDLSGHILVLDCAYGATGVIAPRVLRRFNAEIVELHTQPDGERINQGCGSTHLEPLRAAVRERGAQLGIAFDGDGDRVLLVASNGETIDGDQMMGIAALHMKKKGLLHPPLVVATVMTNLGLERALSRAGIELERTPVGDRNVAQVMRARGAKIGGEQSGHVVFADHSPTGDGILTAVKLLEIAHERGRDLLELAREIPLCPQLVKNVALADPTEVLARPAVQAAIEKERSGLGERGRILVRASGTQPLARVMVEAEEFSLCEMASEAIIKAIHGVA